MCDDSHLFKSLGCAAENIVAAAPVYGFGTDVQVEDDMRIVIRLTKCRAVNDQSVLEAIAERQCTKTPYTAVLCKLTRPPNSNQPAWAQTYTWVPRSHLHICSQAVSRGDKSTRMNVAHFHVVAYSVVDSDC